MRYKIKQWFAVLLSLIMTFTTLPATVLAESVTQTEGTKVEQVQTLIDALPEAEEITADNRTDVQTQIDAIDAVMLDLTEEEDATLDVARYDAAAAALLALDAPTGDNGMEANIDPNPKPSALKQVQDLIDAIPDADAVTADNRADVQAQITAIDEAMQELSEDEAAELDTARYDAAAAALLALDAPTGDNGMETHADPAPEPGTLEQVQDLIDALPDADAITDENRADVEIQLTAIDEAKLALEDEELDALDITRYLAAVEAILALDNMTGANEPMTIASNIPYIDANGRSQTRGSATDITSKSTTWNGWYVVRGSVTIKNRITVSGAAHLILTDGCTLTAQKGIQVAQGKSLTIYGQSGQSGKLSATGYSENYYTEYAGIGVEGWKTAGTITINGGNITATGAHYAAGIGGGQLGNFGTIIINGGNITATGGGDAAGIGNGMQGKAGNITINGGNITATGASSAAGIGGGYGSGAGTITINGGNITSTGQEGGAGIGSGYNGSGGTITISGGNVTATANRGSWYRGSGIGGGSGGYIDSFSTGGNGNAVIHTNSISDESKKDSWSGIIFENNIGTVYGDQTLSGNFGVKDGETLNIPNESSLTVTDAVTNQGTIEVWGVLEGDQKITNSGNGKIIYHYNPQVTAPAFDYAKYGYSEPEAQSITIQNNGGVSVDITDVNITGNDFELIKGTSGTLRKGESNETWKIKPRAGLDVGEYTTAITVSYIGTASREGGTLETEVSFSVSRNETNLAAEDVTYTYGTDGGITLTATVAPVAASGIALMSAEQNQVVFTFPKGSKTKTQTVSAGGGTVNVTIPVEQVKEYFDRGANTVTVSYGGSNNLEQKESVEMTVTVNPKTLTFDFTATSRVYDRTTDVKGSFDLIGVVSGDNVTASYTAAAENADAGEAVGVDVSVTLGGADKDYYTVTNPAGVTVNITPAELELTISDVSITYGDKLTDELLNGTAKIKGTEETVTGTWAWEESSRNEMPAVSDSDKTTYKAVFTPDLEAPANFTEASRSKEVTVAVAKAESAVTKTPVPDNRVYDGADHPLAEAGTAEGGTMQYSLEQDGAYGDAIPHSQGAGKYTVWYKVAGDANHNDTEPQSVNVTIDKGEGTGTVAMKDYTCGDSSVEPVAESLTNGPDAVFTYAEKGTEDFTDQKPDTVGFYTVKAVFPENQNYNGLTLTADFKITHRFHAGWEHRSDGDYSLCACGTELLLKRKELTEVPERLRQNPKVDTVEEIAQVLVEKIDTGDHYTIYDVELEALLGGEWQIIAPENLPEEGVAVTIPYPDGTNARYLFMAVHMFTTAGDGHEPGDTEILETTNEADGIRFTLKSFSPVAIGWKTGNLTVAVTDTGEGVDPAQEWQFRVELDEKTVSGEYGGMNFTDGVAEFTLRSGQSLTAQNLPAGVAYTVTELNGNRNGYTTTCTDDSGIITSEQDMTAAFVNDKPAQEKPDIPSDDPDNPPDIPTDNEPDKSPYTGDESRLTLWFSLTILSLIGITVIVLTSVIGRKKIDSTNGKHMRK